MYRYLLLGLSILCAQAFAQTQFAASLDGAEEVPSGPLDATRLGIGDITLNAAETEITVRLNWVGLSATPDMAHIHGPADPGMNGPVIFPLAPLQGTTTGGVGPLIFAVTPGQVAELKARKWYFNIHTPALPGGEIRGQLVPKQTTFTATPRGALETTQNFSLGKGYARLEADLETGATSISTSFRNLGSNVTAVHIHGPGAPGVNAPVLFTLGPITPGSNSGEFTNFFTLNILQGAQLAEGLFYVNIHSVDFPNGELRGQLLPGLPNRAVLSGAQEVPPVNTPARGEGFFWTNYIGTRVFGVIDFQDLPTNLTGSHIHTAPVGSNGSVIVNFPSPPLGSRGTQQNLTAPLPISEAQRAGLATGAHYFNFHTSQNPGGEIRGQIDGSFGSGFE